MPYNPPPSINPDLVSGPAGNYSYAGDSPSFLCVDTAPNAVAPTAPYGVSGQIELFPATYPPIHVHEWSNLSEPKTQLPTDAAERKGIPLCTGVLDYFTAALVEVAKCSLQGNIQHNGPKVKTLKWVQDKSAEHADCAMKHLADRGTLDTDGVRHSAKFAWRALALLQMEMQEAGKPLPRAAA